MPLCAADLVLENVRPDGFQFVETMTWRPWECLATTLLVTPQADGTLAVKQYGDLAQPPCCTGTLTRVALDPAPTPVALPAAVPGLGAPTAVLDLHGTTTQYTAEGFGSLWLPLDQSGEVIRVNAASGAEEARVPVGDPSGVELRSDPHAVAVADDGVWVTSAAGREIVLIDPATNAVTRRIAVPGEPYAIAIKGRRAWVGSFQDDVLVAVDLEAGTVLATAVVAKPTGVAVEKGGVWVVEHRSNTVVHLDPETLAVEARIDMGSERPNGLCGFCIENVIVAEGSVWTADNYRQSVTRIDPATDRIIDRIATPHRVWDVEAGGGAIWASQFDEGGMPVEEWQTARIDPASGALTVYPLPAQSVSWAGDALWTGVPARRSDVLVRVLPAS